MRPPRGRVNRPFERGALQPRKTPSLPQALDFENYEALELLTLLGRLDYQINEQTAAGVFYRYEDYTIDSFILQGLTNYLPGALLLNPEQGDYQANIFGLELKLAF